MKIKTIRGSIDCYLSGKPIEKLKAELGLKDEFNAEAGHAYVFDCGTHVLIHLEILIKKEGKGNEG